MTEDSTAIVPNMTVTEAIELFEQCCREVRDAYAAIAKAKRRLGAFGDHIRVGTKYDHHEPSWERPGDVLEHLEKQVWAAIVARTGVRGVMSVRARDELDRQLEKGDMPKLTVDNVLGMMRGMHAQIPEMVEEAIREVWQWLRPPEESWMAKEYKSNPRFELGKCVKLTGAVQCLCSTYWVRDYSEKRLDALERVFKVLDGKGAAQRGHRSKLVDAINKAKWGTGVEVHTEYFRVKLYKKGAAHVWFERPDLVAEFNRVCGGMTLKGERAA